MARPLKNGEPTARCELRMPISLLDALRAHGEVSAQIVEAVRVYLDVCEDMPAKSPHSLAGEPQPLKA